MCRKSMTALVIYTLSESITKPYKLKEHKHLRTSVDIFRKILLI